VRALADAAARDGFEVVEFRQSHGEPPTGPSRLVTLERSAPACREEMRPRPTWVRRWARGVTPFAVRYSLGFSRETRRLSDVLRRCPVDVLHTSETGCEESAVAARLAGIPAVIGTLHVLPEVDVEHRQQGWIHRRLERRGVHALDLAIAVCEAGRTAWMRRTGLPSSRIVTVHNGINTREFQRRRAATEARRALGLPTDDEAVVIGTLARLARVKGLESLISAAACLRAQGSNVRVVIAGSGPLLEELRQLAAREGLGPRVHFLGNQADVPPVLEAFDIFALPSRSEALPYAVMEAMAMELPVVATEVGGVPEIVAPDETGFLVPAGSAEALAATVRPLIESAALRQRMGLAGRRRVVELFDERRMADRTVGLYRSLMRRRRVCA
jgi:glycosyltransferase involved in cell wall biosynthesis